MPDQPTLGKQGVSKKLLIGAAVVIMIAAAALYFGFVRPRPDTKGAVQVDARGGMYENLSPGQKRLVDDWAERYSKVTGGPAAPAKLYEGLALSTKTTFSAVTHALSQTKLTDDSGQPMNLTALDLIERIDTVAGRVPGKGGDKQFRIYVELKPGTKANLEKCREFNRQVDNTVYHKGYPTCFRGSGGTPSIQFSLSRDEKRGDVDVDYRSSTFPVMLVNGHLTASNSDVRAGDNDQRHNTHWAGLRNWWQGFMGLPYFEAPGTGAAGAPASEPRLGKDAKPEEAIHDFLNAWLVEQNSRIAAGYISPRAFACMELERGIPVDRGVARIQMMQALETAGKMIGKVRSLDKAVGGVALKGPRGKVVEQPYHSLFVMYDVREDLAEQLDCENRLHPELADPKKGRSTDFGEYAGAVFQLNTPTVKGEIVATIWAKDKSGWTLVSYDVEPELRPGAYAAPPPEAVSSAEAALPVIDGPPDLKRAVGAFFDAWFVKKDVAAAFRFLAASCYSCYNVQRAENLPQANSPAEAGKLIQERMKILADWVGTGGSLADFLVAPEPHHHDLKLVRHSQEQAFALASLPDYMGAAADCAKLEQGGLPRLEKPGPNSHGRFYAAGFRLKKAGAEAAILWTVWSQRGGGWKMISYLVVTP